MADPTHRALILAAMGRYTMLERHVVSVKAEVVHKVSGEVAQEVVHEVVHEVVREVVHEVEADPEAHERPQNPLVTSNFD